MLGAIHAELERLYTEGGPHEKVALMAAGFVDGIKRPSQPGHAPDSDENLAVRARRVLSTKGGVTRVGATETDAFKRARRRGIHRAGELTEYGEALLAVVDQVKKSIRAALQSDGQIQVDTLPARLPTYSDDVLEAAVLDLDLDGEVELRPSSCSTCGRAHVSIKSPSAP